MRKDMTTADWQQVCKPDKKDEMIHFGNGMTEA